MGAGARGEFTGEVILIYPAGCVDNRSFGAGDRTRCLLHFIIIIMDTPTFCKLWFHFHQAVTFIFQTTLLIFLAGHRQIIQASNNNGPVRFAEKTS